MDLMQQLIHELQSEADEYQLVVARSCLRILLAEVAPQVCLSLFLGYSAFSVALGLMT